MPKINLGRLSYCFFLATTSFAEDIVFPGTEWEMATPESMGVNPQLLEAAIPKLPNSSRTMVIRDGKVIWQGNSVDSRYHVWSVTKSFASTAAGLLVDDGIITVNSKVADHIPELTDRYPALTFEHLLKQSGGISGNFLSPGQPLFEPGTQFVYNWDADNHALSFALSIAAGESFEDIIVSRVAEPIGMDLDNIEFEDLTQRFRDRTVEFQRANHGLEISSSDLARYGLLYLNGGVWDGERILSEEWIDAATQVQVKDVPNSAASIGDFVGTFGYGWWILDKGGQFNAFGFDNNQLLVDPVSGFVVSSVGAGGSQANFVAGLEEAEMPYGWDAAGDGGWHEVDPITGRSRWLIDGVASDGFPRGKAVISSGTVHLGTQLHTRSIQINGAGSLNIGEAAGLVARDVVVDQHGRFEAEGQVRLTNLDVLGEAATGASSSVEIDTLSAVGGSILLGGAGTIGQLSTSEQASVVIDGPISIDSATIRDSHVQLRNGDGPVRMAGRLRMTGDSKLSVLLDGDSWERMFVFEGGRNRPSVSGVEFVVKLDPSLDVNSLVDTSFSFFDWGARPPSSFGSVSIPTRIEADLSELFTKGELRITSVLTRPTLPGDFNADTLLDAEDLDELASRIHVTSKDLYYDVDSNGEVSQEDLTHWLRELKDSRIGDVDLNGKVDFKDFTTLSTNFGMRGGWQHGDLDGNGWVEFTDFLFLSANFEETQLASVPEPSAHYLLVVAVIMVRFTRRRQSPNRGVPRTG